MQDSFIKFSSITQAIKAQQLLKKLKIKSELERVSNNQSYQGCGYKLKINSNIKKIKDLLIKNNIKFIN
ncbi:MAG: DUF3343 domain-containing protein [Oscillospiraceae bacterium]|nr:DUF3343 domain-containing protein [Oscillospiraceae bacterium]